MAKLLQSILVLSFVPLLMGSYLIIQHLRGDCFLWWQKKPIAGVRHESGFAYTVPLGQVWMSAHKKPSPARVLEDGRLIGPGNSLHEDIRKTGRGRFSFWLDQLYFSASDNSDPRSNGKKYEILWPVPIKDAFVWILTLAAFLSLIFLLAFLAKLVRDKARFKTISVRDKILFAGVTALAIPSLLFALGLVIIVRNWNTGLLSAYEKSVSLRDDRAVPESPVYQVIKSVNLQELLSGLHFEKGNLEVKAADTARALMNERQEMELFLPALGEGEYSNGFNCTFNLKKPKAFGRYRAYLVVEGHGSDFEFGKDLFYVIDVISDQRISYQYTTGHPRAYYLYLGEHDADHRVKVRFFSQNSEGSRRELKYSISQIKIVYVDSGVKTDQFLKKLNVNDYALAGMDVFNPKYNHDNEPSIVVNTNAVPCESIIYDWRRIERKQKQLLGVDRKKVLNEVFKVITKHAKTDTEKHIALVEFLQKCSFHNAYYVRDRRGIAQMIHWAVYPDKKLVYDPLLLLELNEMGCGQVARLAVDIFQSVGMEARVVQLGGHQIAEIFYDNSWHYFDADSTGGGQIIFLPDGTIPSVEQLLKQPYLYDAFPGYAENDLIDRPAAESSSYLSAVVFRQAGGMHNNQGMGMFCYYVKHEQPENEMSYQYGWRSYKEQPFGAEKKTQVQPYTEPGPVKIKQVSVITNDNNCSLFIQWSPAQDADNDLLGYRIYVSRQSRGWSYPQAENPIREWQSGAPANGAWIQERYNKLFNLPPCEVALVNTTNDHASIKLQGDSAYFVTIMPYDKHGESVGRKIYKMSDEIIVKK